ncbi:hypothetical protein OROMI_015453 [Orobanche minor]
MALSSLAMATLFVVTVVSLVSPSQSATCTSQTFTNNKLYALCNDLPHLNSYLHWTFDRATSTLSIAFISGPVGSSGWVSWAINPTGTNMAGSQALIAFKDAKGKMTVKTYNITGYGPLTESKVWYAVRNSSAEFSGGVMTIFATVVLPVPGLATVNQVWQMGSSVTGGSPDKHAFQPENLNAKGTLDLLGGQSNGSTGSDSRTKKRNIHGVLNVVSWGIMFPTGIVIARYMRVFPSADPAWFYLHISCQISAYAIGVAGWGTGLKLGSDSKGITYSDHRNIGISLFCLATVQYVCIAIKTQEGPQIPFVLEYLPSRIWILDSDPRHHQCVQRFRHITARRQVENRIYCCDFGFGSHFGAT